MDQVARRRKPAKAAPAKRKTRRLKPRTPRETTDRLFAEASSRTVWQTVSNAARASLDRFALIAADDNGTVQRLTYRELLARVRAFSTGLASIGVRRGDRVVLWMTNTPEWVITFISCMRIGATLVPINPFLEAGEIAALIAQSSARHLILVDRFRDRCFLDTLAEICPEFAQTKAPGAVLSSRFPDLRNVVVLARAQSAPPGAFDFMTLEALSSSEAGASWSKVAEQMERVSSSSDLGMIKYTSGTSGPPKGVMLEQGGLAANGVLHSRRIGIRRTDVFFSMMPFFHGGGSIYGQLTVLVNGGTLVFTETFNPTLAVRLVSQEQATIEFGVLTREIVQAALEQGRVLNSVRMANLPNNAARRVMPNVTFTLSAFGLTETYGPVSITSPDDPLDKQTETSGRLLEGYECRAIDPTTGTDVPPGQPGEAWVRGNIMRGYWNNPEETARAIDSDGWLHSQDLITIDADGYVTWLGRLKLTLEVDGAIIPIEEVERIVEGHEAVQYCAVASVADTHTGEFLRIYAIVAPGRDVSESDLQHWLKQRLAAVKIPREIEFVPTLPRLANGKIDRLKLAQWAKTEPRLS